MRVITKDNYHDVEYDSENTYITEGTGCHGVMYHACRVCKCGSMPSKEQAKISKYVFSGLMSSEYSLGSPVDDCKHLKEAVEYVLNAHKIKEIYEFTNEEREQLGKFILNRLAKA
jgi:hypothetical protein